MNTGDPTAIHTARLLAARLERLSADSFWAHKASGLRGAILRCLDNWDQMGKDTPSSYSELLLRFEQLNRQGFEVLINAAREIRPPYTT